MAYGTRSRRERAFLGDVPEDFLRVEPSPASIPASNGTDGTAATRPPGQTYQPTSHPYYPAASYPRAPPAVGYPATVPLVHLPAAVYSPYSYSTTRGRIRMTVNNAQLAKNYGLTRMDPYCRLRIGHQVFETDTDISGSKNPRWNKSFTCNLDNGTDSMYVEVFDERTFAMDERVAYGHFEFPESLYSNGDTMDLAVPLSGKQGEGKEGTLHVTVTFTPLARAASYQLNAYGNQPVSMTPPTMPGAQVFYNGGYPPAQGTQMPSQQPPVMRQRGSPLQKRQEQIAKDVATLQDMFPAVDQEVIRSVLEANSAQMEPTITSLLQMAEGQ